MKYHIYISIFLIIPFVCAGQHEHHHSPAQAKTVIDHIEPQPLLAQAVRLKEALSFLGSALRDEDQLRLESLQKQPLTKETTTAIQNILDPYCLAFIDINPEARVKVERGPAIAKLMQNGWTSFLVKVKNDAGVTARLKVESPQAAPAFHIFSYPMQARARKENLLTEGQVANRFLEIQMFTGRPLTPDLSGLGLEYAVVQVYSKDAGKREAEIGFSIGHGTQDIGFRSTINILFDIARSVKVVMDVKDHDGTPTTASFIITDGIERIIDETVRDITKDDIDYRLRMAQMEFNPGPDYKVPKRLTGIYPLPSRRVAAFDEYPDFFFQPQIYRADGEHVLLPPGNYNVQYTRGPEYHTQTKKITVPEGVDSLRISFTLQRWIDMSALGWYSADHHVHAAGCSHYESPEEGVRPPDMWRQIEGEDLNVGAVLAWGPGWYHQKQFFSGNDHPLSTAKNIMHYDVEVSGFPSSHAGHIVLLNLKEDDYPGTTEIEQWPSWTLPVFQWAKSQGALTGYAHSGWGLEPVSKTNSLPNYAMPKMDGIGANEYIVTVTENVVDFYSAGDTPIAWELNMWYHTLNAGFRTRLSGETDYPCIFDERVGIARSYFKPEGKLTYERYIDAIRNGRSYVSEGGSHLIDFKVNNQEAGVGKSELHLNSKSKVTITARAVAFLPEQQTEEGAKISSRALYEQPYWSIERARVKNSRRVPVELIVNGEAVDTAFITADGEWNDITFNYDVTRSSWIALRIFASAHTNPVFVLVGGDPIAIRKSAQWCLNAVEQCWNKKRSNIRSSERRDAEAAYDRAIKTYERIISKAKP